MEPSTPGHLQYRLPPVRLADVRTPPGLAGAGAVRPPGAAASGSAAEAGLVQASRCLVAFAGVAAASRRRCGHAVVARRQAGRSEATIVKDPEVVEASREEPTFAAAWHRYAVPSDWAGEYTTVAEFGPEAVEVEGAIPADLLGGVLYRCGPGGFERGGVRYNHVLDGDGFVYAIRLDPSPTALGRFVKTPEFQAEEAQDKILFRSTFGTQPSGADAWKNILDLRLKNLANTTAWVWGSGEHKRLLAFFEAGLPHRLDPVTLATLGLETFDGELRPGTAVSLGFGPLLDQALGFGTSHTAHPHVDPVKNRLVCWWSRIQALEGKGRITVREWDDRWQAMSTIEFDYPSELVPHDFALTPSYYIWCENRIVFKGRTEYLLGLKGPAEGLHVEQGAPNRFHLVARGIQGEARPLTVEVPPWFCIHHSHAEEEELPNGDRLISVFSAGWKEEGLASGTFLSSWSGHVPDFEVIASTYYWKTVIRVSADGSAAEMLEHGVLRGLERECIDHPHVDPRAECRMLPAGGGALTGRYCFMNSSNDEDISGPPLGWLRVDLATGEVVRWEAPHRSGQIAEEVVVVPKAAPSGGCWLLSMMSDARRGRSSLCILDGDRVEAGPVARVWLPSRMPHGLHGCFSPAGS